MEVTIDKHKENLLYIMDSMPDDACGDWRDSLAYAVEIMQKYQKIEQILSDWINDDLVGMSDYWMGRIKEVVENGNDDCN